MKVALRIFILLSVFLAGPDVGGAKNKSKRNSKKSVSRPTTSRLSRRVTDKLTPKLKKLFKEKSLTWGAPIYIRVFKHTNELELWVQMGKEYILFKNYPICYFSGHVGPKRKRGDRQAPEGFYSVTAKRMNPNSSYHLSFDVGYPNDHDRRHGRTGGNLMIHGGCVSLGCLAMTNGGIEEIYTIVEASLIGKDLDATNIDNPVELPIHIFPFRMTLVNRWRFVRFRWWDFWSQLKPAYDYFEEHRQVPTTYVINGRYEVDN